MTMPANPPSDHDSYYALIGKIASAWATLEAIIDSTLWELVSVVDENVACLTAQYVGLNQRMNALMALVRLQGGSQKLIDDIEQFQKDSRGLVEQRNRAVHDPIQVSLDGQLQKVVITAQKILKFEVVPLDREKLLRTIENIRTLTRHFGDLRDQIIRETREAEYHETKAFLESYLQQQSEPSQAPIDPNHDAKEH